MTDDPLPTWNNGAAKAAILDFVARVTEEGGPDHVRPEERIATFDNDGTLWCEQPVQTQVFFLMDRVKELAPQLPEGFQQVHRGTIVNLNAVAAAVRDEAGRVSLRLRQRNGTLAVSRVYADLFRAM